ncbi:type II toxin-antitoxin system RelE/ParE family toxin [Kluyvera ascorbata]|uniref:type II toxin-antitoxin system RelE/ParE family toxin n=1 Tax=Kluyvera ascorbata TaxID=51288 RepID=UPI00280450F9|nr:type II toxin-antitoxin system RelE/ParE family toxin [Kluyvera ascorbata]MDU3912654.1 type II toxin-antitoxin system RelE/ParE family toxin [Kluyvera ascorbata]
MTIYKAKRFNQNTKKLGITDDVLLKAAEDIKQGVWEANLGGGGNQKAPASAARQKRWRKNRHLFQIRSTYFFLRWLGEK